MKNDLKESRFAGSILIEVIVYFFMYLATMAVFTLSPLNSTLYHKDAYGTLRFFEVLVHYLVCPSVCIVLLITFIRAVMVSLKRKEWCISLFIQFGYAGLVFTIIFPLQRALDKLLNYRFYSYGALMKINHAAFYYASDHLGWWAIMSTLFILGLALIKRYLIVNEGNSVMKASEKLSQQFKVWKTIIYLVIILTGVATAKNLDAFGNVLHFFGF